MKEERRTVRFIGEEMRASQEEARRMSVRGTVLRFKVK
jgi:hypothetical protein